MRLSRQSVQRIGNAVRTVEAGAARRDGMRGDPMGSVLRLAQIGDAVDTTPGAGEPYKYEADLFTGQWDDAMAARDSIAQEIEVWSAAALAADAWVAATPVGAHWEVVGAQMNLSGMIRYDTTSHQVQVLVGATWTMITGGQAVP